MFLYNCLLCSDIIPEYGHLSKNFFEVNCEAGRRLLYSPQKIIELYTGQIPLHRLCLIQIPKEAHLLPLVITFYSLHSALFQ